MAGDVLENNESWSALADDAGDVGPQVAIILNAAAQSSIRERLARVARSDEIHDSTPRSTVEGGKVAPDRSLIQARLRHARRQNRGCMSFALDVTDRAITWNCSGEGKVEPADTGAEREAEDGMCSHITDHRTGLSTIARPQESGGSESGGVARWTTFESPDQFGTSSAVRMANQYVVAGSRPESVTLWRVPGAAGAGVAAREALRKFAAVIGAVE